MNWFAACILNTLLTAGLGLASMFLPEPAARRAYWGMWVGLFVTTISFLMWVTG